MKRIIAASLLGISATVNTVYGDGLVQFSNYAAPYVPIQYGTGLGGGLVAAGDGVQIEVWAAPGNVPKEALAFLANANLSAFAGYTDPTQIFTLPGYTTGQTWTLQLRALGSFGGNAVGGTGPLVVTSAIGDQTVDPSEQPEFNYTPGFGVYEQCADGPPGFTSQPADQVATVGTDTEFSISVDEDGCYAPAYRYQWQLDQMPIAGATNSTLTLTNVQLADSGHYRVEVTRIVTNSFSLCSSTAILQVLPPNAPSTEVDGRPAVDATLVTDPAEISFSGGFSGGFIFYTLDGSTPSTGSPLYSGSFIISTSATVRAMGLSADFAETAYSLPVNIDFVPGYILQTSVSGSGTVYRCPDANLYPSNTVITLLAMAAQYWAFDQWTGDITGSVNPTSIAMDGPRNVQAVFEQTHYPLTVDAPGGGSIEVNGQSVAPVTYYTTGSLLSLEATPLAGWSFLTWQGAVQSTNPAEQLTMSGPNIVQAIFGTEVGTSVSGNGSIVISHPNPAPYGTLLEATAVPEPGNYFRLWGGAVSGTNDSTSLTVTQVTPLISALFGTAPLGNFTINARVNGGGLVTVDPEQPFYPAGSSVAITAISTNGQMPFLGWSGDASGTNNPITVVLDENKVVYANFAGEPVVDITPKSAIVLGGGNVTLTANAGGLPPFYYEWNKDSAPIAGANSDLFTITDAQAADTGNYSVIVSNLAGVVTSEVATVTVVFPPEITLNPFSQNLPAGDSMTLAVLADGTPPLSYKWYKNSVQIPPLYGTNSTLVVDPLTTNSTGSYWVVVSNPYGAATSSVANVFVYIPVSIVLPPVSKVAPAFSTVQFGVVADGYPDPGYQWFFDGGVIPGGTLPMLTVSNLDLPDLGQYSVLVSNAYSSQLSPPATLSMSPSIVSPFVGATAIWGLDALLSVGAIGSDTLGYQWYKDGGAIGGATSDTLLIPSVQFTNAGLYSVVVSSIYGDVTNTPAQLVVNPAGVSLGLYAGITINGAIGNTLTIEYTTDLTDTNSWLFATNLTLQQEVELWVDESVEARSLPKRFYRVLPGP